MHASCFAATDEDETEAGSVRNSNADEAHERDDEAAVDCAECSQHKNGVRGDEKDGNLDEFEIGL